MRGRRRSPERRALERYLETVFGAYRVVRELSRSHGNSCVLLVVDSAGDRWVAKRHVHSRAFRREARAYRIWTPVLGDHAPALHRADAQEGAIVLTAVPGSSAAGVAAQVQAGALLRRLHEAEPPRQVQSFAADYLKRLDGLLDRSAGLIDRREVDYVRSEVSGLRDVPTPGYVPCHGDYTPSNWLVDSEGTMRVVDFGGSRRQPWVRDLNRLYFGEWAVVPEYADAFLEGYGRDLTGDDLEFLRRTGALTAVSRMVWGLERGIPSVTADGRRILRALMSEQR